MQSTATITRTGPVFIGSHAYILGLVVLTTACLFSMALGSYVAQAMELPLWVILILGLAMGGSYDLARRRPISCLLLALYLGATLEILAMNIQQAGTVVPLLTALVITVPIAGLICSAWPGILEHSNGFFLGNFAVVFVYGMGDLIGGLNIRHLLVGIEFVAVGLATGYVLDVWQRAHALPRTKDNLIKGALDVYLVRC